MINWYNFVTENPDDLENLVAAIAHFEEEFEESKKDVAIFGSFQKMSSELPGIMTYRYGQLQELESILEFLNLKRTQAHQKAFKMYLENYNRSLTSRDAERYANADKTVIEMSMLWNQVNLLKQKFIGITKGLETKHYQLGYLSRLKVAGLEDYFID